MKSVPRKRINLWGIVWCLLVLANGPVDARACACPGAEDLTLFQRLLGICCPAGHHHGEHGSHHHHSDFKGNLWVAEAEEECRHFELTNPDPCLRVAFAAAMPGSIQAVVSVNMPATVYPYGTEIKRFAGPLQVKPPDIYTRTVILRI
jgi:hypothetical protein